VPLLEEDPDLVLLVGGAEPAGLGQVRLQPAQELAGAVRGPVVDDEDLLGDGHRLDSLEDLGQGQALVVHRHDDGQAAAPGVHGRHYSVGVAWLNRIITGWRSPWNSNVACAIPSAAIESPRATGSKRLITASIAPLR